MKFCVAGRKRGDASILESSHRYLLEGKFCDPASARQPPALRFGSHPKAHPLEHRFELYARIYLIAGTEPVRFDKRSGPSPPSLSSLHISQKPLDFSLVSRTVGASAQCE
jgi:hypothetical protein